MTNSDLNRIHQRLDRIEQMLAQLTAALFVSAPSPAPIMSIGDQALQLARQGKIEESKALLKAHSKRRAA